MEATIELMPSSPLNETPYAEWSDEDLLLEYCATGRKELFQELVTRYERELYNYLCHYLGNAEWAEDVFQTTFLQIHLKGDRFESGRRFRPWLYTVATNQAIDFQRRNKRHRLPSLDQACTNGQEDNGASMLDMMADDTAPATEMLVAAEEEAKVKEAVALLPENFREALVLVFYQGMKYREAADVLDVPVGTVKSRVHVALKKLNNLLSSQEPAEQSAN